MAEFDVALQVVKNTTPVTLDALRASLSSHCDWGDVALAYLLALCWVETDHGKRLFNFNVGNLAAGGYRDGIDRPWWSGPYWRPDWYESPPTAANQERHERMLRGEAPSAFRAYASLDEGVAGFCRLLENSRFEGLRAAAEADDVEAFVVALHDSGYSRDYGPQHVPTFTRLLAEIRGGEAGPSRSLIPVGIGLAVLGGAVYLGLRKGR